MLNRFAQASEARGFTLIELLVTLSIVAMLAGLSMPLLQMTVQRNKESELKANLRQIREAIDGYKNAVDTGHITKSIQETGYPPNLEILVEGVEDKKDPEHRQIKFLRKIPLDPMTKENSGYISHNWGLRSYKSSADKPVYDQDVYDVYSLSKQNDMNGVPYANW